MKPSSGGGPRRRSASRPILVGVTGCVLAVLPACGAPPGDSPAPPTNTRTAPGEALVSGVVETGVEPGCLILRTGSDETYLLLGGDRDVLVPGRRVTVRGHPRHDLATTCQQGVPLEVRTATSRDG